MSTCVRMYASASTGCSLHGPNERVHSDSITSGAVITRTNIGTFDLAELAALDAAGQCAGEQRVPGLDDFIEEEARDFRKVAAFRHDELAEATGLAAAVVVPPAGDQRAQQLGTGSVEAQQFFGGLADASNDVVAHDRLEEFFLVLEVQVQRAFRDAGAAGDILEPRAGVAFLDEELQSSGSEFGRAGVLAALPAWSGNGTVGSRWPWMGASPWSRAVFK